MKKVIGVLAAVAAGFTAGVLLAPKSGKETRQDIANKAKDAKNATKKKADQVGVAAKEGFEVIKHGARDAGEEVKDILWVIYNQFSSSLRC